MEYLIITSSVSDGQECDKNHQNVHHVRYYSLSDICLYSVSNAHPHHRRQLYNNILMHACYTCTPNNKYSTNNSIF